MSKDVTGLAVALTATARTRANQLSRDLQTASRRLDAAGDALTAARRASTPKPPRTTAASTTRP